MKPLDCLPYVVFCFILGLNNVFAGQELGSANNDLLDEVARRLLEEGDFVHGPPAFKRETPTRSGTEAKEAGSYRVCSQADELYGPCSKDGLVCPLAGQHTSYLKCVHSNWLAMPCAPGTMFDATSKSCASPHDIQPTHPQHQQQWSAFQRSFPGAQKTSELKDEQERPLIQNDSPYGPRIVGYMDYPPPGYAPYPAPVPNGHFPPVGQYSPQSVYPNSPVLYQPMKKPVENNEAPGSISIKKDLTRKDNDASHDTEDGKITQEKGQHCQIGAYRAVPGNSKYYEHCIHSGTEAGQWMRRLCPPGMVADENPQDLPCRFSLNLNPKKHHSTKQQQEQDTKPKSSITDPYKYKYKAPSYQPKGPGYVVDSHKRPPAVFYYQQSPKIQKPEGIGNQESWNPNAAPYSPIQPYMPDEHPEERDPFKNGERVVHNVNSSPYDPNQDFDSVHDRFNVDRSRSGRQGSQVSSFDRNLEEESVVGRPVVPVVPETVNYDQQTTLPSTTSTEATTPLTIPAKRVFEKQPVPEATPPTREQLEPEPKEAGKPTQMLPNYLDNKEFMNILRNLAAKYIENITKGPVQNSSAMDDRPTETSFVPDEEPSPDANEAVNSKTAEDVGSRDSKTTKGNDVIIDFDSGRYEMPFIVDMDDLVLWPRDVATGGEKTEKEAALEANPFYLLKLPNTAVRGNKAAAEAAGLNAS